MKKILLLTISLMVFCAISAKDTYTYQLVKPSGEPVEEYVYPGLANYYGYKIVLSPSPNGFSKGVFKVTLTNGKFSDGKPERTNVQVNETFSVTWDDVSNATGTVKISTATPSDTSATILKAGTPIQMSHKIASLKGQTPGLSVSGNPLIGSKQVITAQITTEATYPNIQEYSVTEGTINKRAEYYEWTLPANWTAAGQNGNTFIIGAQQKSISITPDNVTSGAVKIRALNPPKTAGSEIKAITLDRGFAYTAYPTSITFGDNSQKTFTVTPFNGVTYEWSVPSNWKINGQGNTFEGLNQNSINVTPDFCPLTDAKVKVRLKKDGDVSQWYDFPSYIGVKQPTISSAAGTIYQYENANFSISNISTTGVSSITWSGDSVFASANQGVNSKIAFGKPGTIALTASILMNGCSTPIVLPAQLVVVNSSRLSLTGSTPICSQGTYNLNNLPLGNALSWSHSANLNEVSGQGTGQYTVGIYSSGLGWVKAIVNGIALPQKDVWVGVPGRHGPMSIFCQGQSQDALLSGNWVYSFYIDSSSPIEGVTQVDWLAINGTIIDGQGTSTIKVLTDNVSTTGYALTLKFRSTNDCGTSTFRTQSFTLYPSGSIQPAPKMHDSLDEVVPAIESVKDETSYNVLIYDQLGRVLLRTTQKGADFSTSTSNMPNGTYIVKLYNDKTSLQRKLIVKH